jgi:hypothetical protein
MSSFLRVLVTCLTLTFTLPAFGEDASSEIRSTETPAAEAVETQEGSDETQKMISQLTIAMSAEVIDERTFAIRDASKGSKQIHICIGNTGPTPRGSLDDGEYAEKVKVAKEALGKLVDKQMIWYKPAPDAVQPANSSGPAPVVFADVWSIDGKHIGGFLKKEGHLLDEKVYETDLAKDILTVASEGEKKESYKKLEEALKESEEAKQAAAKAMRAKAEEEEAAENVENFGLAGWLSVAMVLVIVIGAATNFGRPTNKKANLNRRRGALERFWMKLKGA